MLEIIVSDQTIDHCKRLKRIDTPNTMNETTPFWGLVGEAVIKDVLRMLLPETGSSDGGHDFKLCEIKFDIKTVVRQDGREFKPDFWHNVHGHQKDNDSDAFIFLAHRVLNQWEIDHNFKPVIEVCGFIAKAEFFRKAKLTPAGGRMDHASDRGTFIKANGATYSIMQKQINPFRSEKIPELYDEIHRIAGDMKNDRDQLNLF